MPSVGGGGGGGSINHILVWRVSIFSGNYSGIQIRAPGVTASFFLNFLNSNFILFSTDTKHERYFNISSVNFGGD